MSATRILSNTASCGGGIACDSCRAVVTNSTIAGNSAVAELFASTCDLGPKPDDVSTRAGGTPTCLRRPGSSADLAELLGGDVTVRSSPPVQGIVAGAGGAVAAIVGRNSYVAVCGSSRAPLNMTSNSALVGSLVFLSTPANGSNCPDTCPAAGWSPCQAAAAPARAAPSTQSPCGVQLQDVDWTGTVSYGHLPSGSNQTHGFRMMCSNSSWPNNAPTPTTPGSCGCGDRFQASHRGRVLGTSGASAGPVWQLSNTVSLVNATCWSEVLHGTVNSTKSGTRQWPDCAYFNSSSGDAALQPIQVVTGDPVSISVVIGGPWQSVPPLPAPEGVGPPIGSALLSQDSTTTGWVYIVGPTSTRLVGQTGAGTLKDVVFQHRWAPTINREFDVYLATFWGGGLPQQNDVQAKLRVKLLRCSFGRHMTVREGRSDWDTGTTRHRF